MSNTLLFDAEPPPLRDAADRASEIMAAANVALRGRPMVQDLFDAELRKRGIEVPARKRRGALDRPSEVKS